MVSFSDAVVHLFQGLTLVQKWLYANIWLVIAAFFIFYNRGQQFFFATELLHGYGVIWRATSLIHTAYFYSLMLYLFLEHLPLLNSAGFWGESGACWHCVGWPLIWNQSTVFWMFSLSRTISRNPRSSSINDYATFKHTHFFLFLMLSLIISSICLDS